MRLHLAGWKIGSRPPCASIATATTTIISHGAPIISTVTTTIIATATTTAAAAAAATTTTRRHIVEAFPIGVAFFRIAFVECALLVEYTAC